MPHRKCRFWSPATRLAPGPAEVDHRPVRRLVADRCLGWLLGVAAAGLLAGAWPGGPSPAWPAAGVLVAILGRWALARGPGGRPVRHAQGLRRTLARSLLATQLARRRGEPAAAGDAYEQAGRARAGLAELGVAPPLSRDALLRAAGWAAAVLERLPGAAARLERPAADPPPPP